MAGLFLSSVLSLIHSAALHLVLWSPGGKPSTAQKRFCLLAAYVSWILHPGAPQPSSMAYSYLNPVVSQPPNWT
jgi:hypothetical protein